MTKPSIPLEELYRTLFEKMDEGFCVVEMLYDPDGKAVDYRFVEINPAFEKHTGLPQARGKTIRQMVPNHDPHWFEIYGQVARTGQAIRFCKAAKAMQRYYDVFAFRVGGVGSRSVGILFKDITEREQAEEALRESEARYRRLRDSMTDAFASVSMDGRIQECNRAYQTMLGYSDEELKRMTYVDLTPTRWHAFEAGIIEKQVLSRGYSDVYEKEYRKKDGTVFPVELHKFLIRDAAGQPAAMWAIFRDITGRKQAEAALRQSEARYAALFEHNPIETVVVDLQGRIQAFNRAQRKSGHRLPQIGDVMYRDYAGKHTIDMHRELMHCIESGESRHYPERPYGESILSLDIAPFAEGAIITSQDITERKKAEDALRGSREQLRALAARLASILEQERTRFAREIHDELGQSLTAFTLDVIWLAKRLPKDHPALQEKTADMLRLIDTTIQIVRRIAGELRPGILDDLGLAAAIEWQIHEFGQRTRLECHFTQNLEAVELAPPLSTALFRILQEALTNVARHAHAHRVKVRLQQSEDHILLEIADDGQGIPKDAAHHPKSLGLMGMRERALEFGGQVEFLRRPKLGTLVRVTIPWPLSPPRES